MAELIPIVDWTDDSENAIVRVPYPVDVEILVEELPQHKNCAAILPPYSQSDRTFTSRCASVARDKFKGHTILVAIPGVSRKDVQSFFHALQGEGFGIVFPYQIGRNIAENVLRFWGKEFVPNNWYHVAGGFAPDGLPGRWTWSKEKL